MSATIPMMLPRPFRICISYVEKFAVQVGLA